MSAGPEDGLDALLASLLDAAEPPPQARILPERQADLAPVRAWLSKHHPGVPIYTAWQAQPDPGYEIHQTAPEREQLEPEITIELAAAQAWRDGDQVAFEKALAHLPADSADHHRRMAATCEMIKMRQEARARLKGEVRDRTSPAAAVGSP